MRRGLCNAWAFLSLAANNAKRSNTTPSSSSAPSRPEGTGSEAAKIQETAASPSTAQETASAAPLSTSSSSSSHSLDDLAKATRAAKRLGRAMRDRDLQAAQDVLGQHWRDEYAIPILCVAVLLLVYYSTSSSKRSTARRCEAAEARCREDLQLLRDQVIGLTDKWEREIVQRDQVINEVQTQNTDLAKVVDQMTVALKQCPPRGI